MQHHARSASQDLGQNVMENWLNLAGCLRRHTRSRNTKY